MSAYLQNIHIQRVRNLMDVCIDLKPTTLIVGENGSGKTSLLESVFLLSRGKTFRHHEPKRYIHHKHSDCIVRAQTTDKDHLAICKTQNATTTLRFNQTTIKNQIEFIQRLPVVMIEPDNLTVLQDGTQSRRQLLDFLCFYECPYFYGVWLEYQKIIKQRNHLLKSAKYQNTSSFYEHIRAWDLLLSQYAMQLHTMRTNTFLQWQPIFYDQIAKLLPKYKDRIVFEYQAGFNTAYALHEILAQKIHSDIELGYTKIGAHRADLSVFVLSKHHQKQPAIHVLSRGEKKLLITALKLAQLIRLCAIYTDCMPIVLLDDIQSELDPNAQHILLNHVFAMPCQSIITSLDIQTIHAVSMNAHSYLAYQMKDGHCMLMSTQ